MSNIDNFFQMIPEGEDKERFKFKMKIGNYISHEIVDKNMNIKQLNDINKYEYADKFLKIIRENYRKYNWGMYNLYLMIEESNDLREQVALYIDVKIPYFYYIKMNNISNNEGHKFYKGISQLEGKYTYQFEESYNVEKTLWNDKKEFSGKITSKQKLYVHALAADAGYLIMNEEEITKEIARILIGFLADDKPINDEILNKFLIYE